MNVTTQNRITLQKQINAIRSHGISHQEAVAHITNSEAMKDPQQRRAIGRALFENGHCPSFGPVSIGSYRRHKKR